MKTTNLFKRLFTTALAAVMAISAMSMTALATDDNYVPDDIVMSVTAPDGNGKIYLTREDVENGQTSLEGYGGVVFTYVEDMDTAATAVNAASVESVSASTLYFNSTNVPGLVSPINAYNNTIEGNFVTPANSQRFSDSAISYGANTSAVMNVKPTTSITRGSASVSLVAMSSSGTPIRAEGTVYPSGTGTSGIVANGLTPGNYLYIYINNGMTSTIRGKVTLLCSN